jgi:hypothetical protein
MALLSPCRVYRELQQAEIDPLLTVVGVGFAEMKRSREPLTWTESLVMGIARSQA